jgi:hypothetical protein
LRSSAGKGLPGQDSKLIRFPQLHHPKLEAVEKSGKTLKPHPAPNQARVQFWRNLLQDFLVDASL